MLRQNTKDEKEAVLFIRNDRIKEDSMGGTAGADDPQYSDPGDDRLPIYEVDQVTVIISMDMAVSLTLTVRAGLLFGVEKRHVFAQQKFSRPFFTNKLAIDQILSYHNKCIESHAVF